MGWDQAAVDREVSDFEKFMLNQMIADGAEGARGGENTQKYATAEEIPGR